METEALLNLMKVLRWDWVMLAARLGGRKEHYEKLETLDRLPFPVWDAVQRLAHREGYAWDPRTHSWHKAGSTAPVA